jgi:hypothetical protein
MQRCPFSQRRAVYLEGRRLLHRQIAKRQAQLAGRLHARRRSGNARRLHGCSYDQDSQRALLSRLETRFILSKQYGDDLDSATAGTGPYKYLSWQRGGNLVLRRNDDYCGVKPQIREVIIKGVKEELARVAGLLAQTPLAESHLCSVPRLDSCRSQDSSRVIRLHGTDWITPRLARRRRRLAFDWSKNCGASGP